MNELNLITPTLMFSAVSLIMLAYTNRFLSYAQLIRTLKDKYVQHPDSVTEAQIKNLRKRLYLTRNMQILGIGSLFLCMISMFLIYISCHQTAAFIFGLALLLFIGSLATCLWELIISVKALEIYLKDMEQKR